MCIQMRYAQIRHRAFLQKLRIFEGGGLGKAEPPLQGHVVKCGSVLPCVHGGLSPPQGHMVKCVRVLPC